MATNPRFMVSRIILATLFVVAIVSGVAAVVTESVDSSISWIALVLGVVLMAVFDHLGWHPIRKNRG